MLEFKLGCYTPGSAGPWAGPLVSPFCQMLFQRSQNLKMKRMAKLCHRKMLNKTFQRILKLKKYFWNFCKKEKVLEKFKHAKKYFCEFCF